MNSGEPMRGLAGWLARDRLVTVLSFAINRAILGPAPWGYLQVNLLGVSLGQQGKQEAVEAFRRAVELRPEVKEYQANLARESLRP